MRWPEQFARLLLMTALAGCAIPVSAVTYEDGLVLGIVGSWKDAAQKPVHFGAVLNEKSWVSCTGGSLTIWFAALGKPVGVECEKPGEPMSIAEVRRRNTQGSLSAELSRLWQVVQPVIAREPRTYISAVSRGFGNPELEESVALLKGSQADVTHAFAGVAAGPYAVALLGLDEDVSERPPLPVKWQRGSSLLVPVPKTTPSLCKLALVAADGGGTISSQAWVLIEPAAAYERDRVRFDKAREVVRQWPGGVRAQTSRSILRAYLRAISEGAAE